MKIIKYLYDSPEKNSLKNRIVKFVFWLSQEYESTSIKVLLGLKRIKLAFNSIFLEVSKFKTNFYRLD